MGAMKNYLLSLLQAADTQEEEDALEWGIYNNHIKPTYDLKKDHETIRSAMPELLEAWRRLAHQQQEAETQLVAEVFGR